MLGLSAPPLGLIIAAGVTLLTLLVIQILIGYRKIHFKGRTHLLVHKTNAWLILTVAVLHATAALWYLGYLPL